MAALAVSLETFGSVDREQLLDIISGLVSYFDQNAPLAQRTQVGMKALREGREVIKNESRGRIAKSN